MVSKNIVRARVTMLIHAAPKDVYRAFIEPKWLTKFWLSKASGPLRVGEPVEWCFMVAGATDSPEATRLIENKEIAWRWSSGNVNIELEPFDGGTAVTLINFDFPGNEREQIEAALNGTEGFSIVLCDLKTLLESGTSAGLTKAKAALIEFRK